MSVNDFLKPCFPEKQFSSLTTLSQSASEWLNLLDKVIEDEVVLGRLHRKTSNKVTPSSNVLLPKDFVYIPSPVHNYSNSKYGLVIGSVSEHQHKVKIIGRRLKSGTGKCTIVTLPIQRLVLLHREEQTSSKC